DDVPLQIEAAAVARAGDDVLVGAESRDAAEVRADGGQGVHAAGAPDDVGLLLLVETHRPLGVIERAAGAEGGRRLEQNFRSQKVEGDDSRADAGGGAGAD